MTRERILQLIELVLDASRIHLVRTGFNYDSQNEFDITIHDMRSDNSKDWTCTIYCADGRTSEVIGNIRYIEDKHLDAAEAHLRLILEGVRE